MRVSLPDPPAAPVNTSMFVKLIVLNPFTVSVPAPSPVIVQVAEAVMDESITISTFDAAPPLRLLMSVYSPSSPFEPVTDTSRELSESRSLIVNTSEVSSASPVRVSIVVVSVPATASSPASAVSPDPPRRTRLPAASVSSITANPESCP